MGLQGAAAGLKHAPEKWALCGKILFRINTFFVWT
jgi:hypothetical protein